MTAIILSLCVCFITFIPSASAQSENEQDSYTSQVTFSAINSLPDGGLDYVFVVEGAENHYYVPPEDFNPATASDEILNMYGYPPRPDTTNATEYAAWVERMESYTGTPIPEIKTTVRPVTDTQISSVNNTRSVTKTEQSINWSGYIADLGTTGTTKFTQVQADYVHPTIYNIIGSCTISYWVGLGGYNTGNLVQAGTSTTNGAMHSAWYEYLSENGTSVAAQEISSLTVSPGDSIHLYISFQAANGKLNYYIANDTTGKSASGLINLATAYYFDGTTAEWIIERSATWTTSGLHIIEPLANYSTMTMTNCKAMKNTSSSWSNLSDLNTIQFVMHDGSGKILSQPGVIYSGSSFPCYFKDYGSIYIID